MTTQLQATSVSTAAEVQAPIEHAFRVFTEGIGSWWDPGHHLLQAELAEMVFEPYAGGHIIDVNREFVERTGFRISICIRLPTSHGRPSVHWMPP